MIIRSDEVNNLVHISDDAGEEISFDLPVGKIAKIQCNNGEGTALTIERLKDHTLEINVNTELARVIEEKDLN